MDSGRPIRGTMIPRIPCRVGVDVDVDADALPCCLVELRDLRESTCLGRSDCRGRNEVSNPSYSYAEDAVPCLQLLPMEKLGNVGFARSPVTGAQ